MKRYGLRSKTTGNLLAVVVRSNNGGTFCVDSQHELVREGPTLWLVDSAMHAEYVRQFSTPWYNAEYDNPTHNFKADELEVVSVDIVTTVEAVKAKVPSPKEMLEIRRAHAAPGDQRFFDYFLSQEPVPSYLWSELQQVHLAGQLPSEYITG